jgi:hypothetical protein
MLQKRAVVSPSGRVFDPKDHIDVLAVDFDAFHQRSNQRPTFVPLETLKTG